MIALEVQATQPWLCEWPWFARFRLELFVFAKMARLQRVVIHQPDHGCLPADLLIVFGGTQPHVE
jgi:hypothetical protein